MSSLINSKSKILGDDTHASNLSGDLTKDVGTSQGTTGSQTGGLSGGDSADHLLTTIVLTPTEANNLIILKLSVNATNQSDITIDEGGTELGRIDGTSSGTRTLNVILENVSVAAHTYTFFTRVDGGFYQYGNQAIVVYAVVVNLDDTHASALTGANTQETHEGQVLP